MTSTVRLEEPLPISQKIHADMSEPKTAKGEYNPYLAARREWDERYGNLINRERNWRIMAILCSLVALASVGGMIRLSTKSHIVPFVVAMDSLGRTAAAGSAEEASPSDDRLKRATPFQLGRRSSDGDDGWHSPAQSHRPCLRPHRQRGPGAGAYQRVLPRRSATKARRSRNRKCRSSFSLAD